MTLMAVQAPEKHFETASSHLEELMKLGNVVETIDKKNNLQLAFSNARIEERQLTRFSDERVTPLLQVAEKELVQAKQEKEFAALPTAAVKPLEITGEQFELVKESMLVYANSRKEWLEPRGGVLFKDVSSLSKQQQAEALFEASKKNGLLGIVYSPSKETMPKTAEQVLTKEADGKYHADCDEFAYLYAAAAKRLGIEGIGGISISYYLPKKKELELHLHVCLLKFGDALYLIDPTHDILKAVETKAMPPGILEKDTEFQAAVRKLLNIAKNKAGESEITAFHSFHVLGKAEELETIYHYEVGAWHRAQGLIDDSIAYFEKAVKRDTANPIAQLKLGQVYYEKENYDDAIAHLVTGLEKCKDADAYLILSRSYIEKEDFDNAESALINALKIKPRFPEAYHNLGFVAYKRENYIQAIQHYEDAKKYYKQFLVEQKETQEYEETFRKIGLTYYGQAAAYFKAKYYKKARDVLEEAIKMRLDAAHPEIKKMLDDLSK